MRRHGLGPLEMRLLGLIESRHDLTVGDAVAELSGSGEDLAYTTVLTVMTRLHEKGLVSRRKDGRRYVYSPSRAAEPFRRGVVDRVHRALFGNDRTAPIVSLIEDDVLSDQELEDLRALIDRKLEERS